MYSRLEAVLGHEEATVLMEHLPPVGWADVATKRDLDLLDARLRGEMTRVESRIIRTLFVAILGSNATLAGLAFGAARLA
jgi:hypothetical protein